MDFNSQNSMNVRPREMNLPTLLSCEMLGAHDETNLEIMGIIKQGNSWEPSLDQRTFSESKNTVTQSTTH